MVRTRGVAGKERYRGRTACRRGQAMVGMLIFVSATSLLAVNIMTLGFQLRQLAARTMRDVQAMYAAEAGVIYTATQLQTGNLIANFALDVVNKDTDINVVNGTAAAALVDVFQGGNVAVTQINVQVTNWL